MNMYNISGCINEKKHKYSYKNANFNQRPNYTSALKSNILGVSKHDKLTISIGKIILDGIYKIHETFTDHEQHRRSRFERK